MTALRSRIARIEAVIDSSSGNDVDRERQQAFHVQLVELTDDELDRLESIILRMNVLDGDKAGSIPLPEACLHLRDFIAFIEDRPDDYYTADAGYREAQQ